VQFTVPMWSLTLQQCLLWSISCLRFFLGMQLLPPLASLVYGVPPSCDHFSSHVAGSLAVQVFEHVFPLQ